MEDKICVDADSVVNLVKVLKVVGIVRAVVIETVLDGGDELSIVVGTATVVVSVLR